MSYYNWENLKWYLGKLVAEERYSSYLRKVIATGGLTVVMINVNYMFANGLNYFMRPQTRDRGPIYFVQP